MPATSETEGRCVERAGVLEIDGVSCGAWTVDGVLATGGGRRASGAEEADGATVAEERASL